MKKQNTPTPYMPAFDSKMVKVDLGEFETTKAGIRRQSLTMIQVEYRNVCPWNAGIDMLSDECTSCEKNRRRHYDERYPSMACVCQNQIDDVPVPSKARKAVNKVIDARVQQGLPVAIVRHNEFIRSRIRLVNKNA